VPGGAPLEVFARAKVNLTLEILGRREDGYHLLESLVVFAETGDRLCFEPAEILTLDLRGPFAASLPRAEENLVLRAARGLSELAGGGRGASILLEKYLPAAGGIGGGSADAAATLSGLCELWDFRPDPKALYELALSLGADLPVCLNGKPCLMTGIGEELEAAPALPEFSLLLANPGVALSTPEVFAARRGAFAKAEPWPEEITSLEELIAALERRGNGLEAAAFSLAPEVAAAHEALAALPGCLLARMSGSGATCFGLFAELEEARAAGEILKENHPGWWVQPAAAAR
jgi:4-diphosphocytidyl-2-C-methyl-D-erythritol kinase